MSVRFSVITPSCGRPMLNLMARDLLPQLHPRDTWILVMDGPHINGLLDEEIGGPGYPPSRFKYATTVPTGCWGNHQRDVGIALATGTHLLFVDDDDRPMNLDLVREHVAQDPKIPHMFCMDVSEGMILTGNPIREGNVGCTMAVFPNDKNKLVRWEDADNFWMLEFIKGCVAKYGGTVRHHSEIILKMRAYAREGLVPHESSNH